MGDSLFERPGWRAVGTIAGTTLAAAALAWAGVAATSDGTSGGVPSVGPSATLPANPTAGPPTPPGSDPDVPYQIVDGVTVSAYLPSAQPLTPEVLDRVGSGWVLAVFDGGLITTDRVMDDGALYGVMSDGRPAAPRILYLVSPEGDAWEVANLTELGLGEVLAWDPERDVALVDTGAVPQWTPDDERLAVLYMRDGSAGPSFTPCDPDLTQSGEAWPVAGGWALTVYCQSEEPAVLWETAVYVDDRGNTIDPPDLPALAPDAVFYASVDTYFIEFRYPSTDALGEPIEQSYITVTSPNGAARGIDNPVDPGGYDAWMCTWHRLAVPDAVAVTCYGWSEQAWSGPALATTLLVDPASATFVTVSPWLESGYPDEGGFHPGCLIGDREWGTQTANGSLVGLWSRAGGAAEPVPPPPGAYMAIQCVGTVGSELVVRAAGPLLALNPTTGAWRTLLPAAVIPATGGTPARYVAGVTDLGIFVAP